jgi:hypothetical protein
MVYEGRVPEGSCHPETHGAGVKSVELSLLGFVLELLVLGTGIILAQGL